MLKTTNTILLVMVVLGIPFLVFAAPGIPHQFYGTAKYTNGADITSGSVIVKIGTTQVATVAISSGKYGYTPNLLLVTDPDGTRAGQVLKFYVDSVDTGESAVFSNGGYTNLNIDIAPVATPTPTPASGGGGGAVQNPNPSSTPSPTPNPTPVLTSTPAPKIVLTEEAKKVDADNNGIIDVMDFNTLMVNWGNGGGTGDFDGSGSVDVFDFNMLMINWS